MSGILFLASCISACVCGVSLLKIVPQHNAPERRAASCGSSALPSCREGDYQVARVAAQAWQGRWVSKESGPGLMCGPSVGCRWSAASVQSRCRRHRIRRLTSECSGHRCPTGRTRRALLLRLIRRRCRRPGLQLPEEDRSDCRGPRPRS
jgi:hypothetical protein